MKLKTTTDDFQLVIEDSCCASWMCITNTFIRSDPGNWMDGEHLWNGVLIQLGKFLRSEGPVGDLQKVIFEAFAGVELQKSGVALTDYTLGPQDFADKLIWIDIVARTRADYFSPPMELGDLESLLIAPDGEQVPLHKSCKPHPGGITLWYDNLADPPNPQDDSTDLLIKAESQPGAHHGRFTFVVPKTDQFRLAMYIIDPPGNPGSPYELHEFNGSQVDTLVVKLDPGIDHEGHDNPPQY